MRTILFVLITISFVLPAIAAEPLPRTWTAASGKWSGIATLVEIQRGHIVVQRTDGKRKRLAFSQISRKDLTYLLAKSIDATMVRVQRDPSILPKYYGPAYAVRGWFPTDIFPTEQDWNQYVARAKNRGVVGGT